jgi:hypothetical protein
MHGAAILPHRVQFGIVEHLTERLEFIFWRFFFSLALFFVKHAPESLKIGTVLHEAGDVDLRANEVAKIPSRV